MANNSNTDSGKSKPDHNPSVAPEKIGQPNEEDKVKSIEINKEKGFKEGLQNNSDTEPTSPQQK